MDYVLGATALVLLSPLMAVIALAIKLDSAGPVFRAGPDGLSPGCQRHQIQKHDGAGKRSCRAPGPA